MIQPVISSMPSLDDFLFSHDTAREANEGPGTAADAFGLPDSLLPGDGDHFEFAAATPAPAPGSQGRSEDSLDPAAPDPASPPDSSISLAASVSAGSSLAAFSEAFGGLTGMSGLVFIDGQGAAKGGNGGGGGGGNGGGKGGGGNGGNGDGGVMDSYVSGNSDGSGFNIEIVFEGSWTAALQQSFVDASELISDIILGDIGDVFFRGKTIDDLRIEATLSDIDGSGGILGQAGPTAYRTADFLPAMGIMEFDTADAEAYDAAGLFNDIVFHEMMHVLGFGTMWDNMGLLANGPGGTLEFTGVNAATAFALEFGAGPVSVETDGGPGTAGGHWNEGGSDGFAFGNEIMTGYINAGGNYLSNTTIAALEDMGYDTVFDAADPLTATSGLNLSIFSDNMIG